MHFTHHLYNVESCAYRKAIDCDYHNRHTSITEEVERCCLKLQLSIYRQLSLAFANEESVIRRLKEMFAEGKKICQTMGWWDYNQGNLSFDVDVPWAR